MDRYICNNIKKCNFDKCLHSIPHLFYTASVCSDPICQYMGINAKCILIKPKISAKRYSLKQLYDLWIVWGDEKDISFQKLFREFNLDGSFIKWLEYREINKK